MSPVLLIAEREFRTYVATLSFWLSLAVAPLAVGTALLLTDLQQHPVLVTVSGGDSAYQHSASLALEEAGRLEDRSFVFGEGGARLVLTTEAPRRLDVRFGADFPLSPAGRANVRHLMERDAAQRSLGQVPLVVSEKGAGPVGGTDAGTAARMIAMIMLWLTLTGSLGMLLQAVVRERANRSLENLLAATRPWQVLTGKMLGVGCVSLLVLFAWSGMATLFSHVAGHGAPLSAIMTDVSNAAALARDGAIYVCAFAFYGTMTMALGAMARDSAAAQNAARPVFLLLLAVFLVALSASTSHSNAMSWLAWIPPLTPFLLLANRPHNVAWATQALQLGTLLLASAGMSVVAASLIRLVPEWPNILRARSKITQDIDHNQSDALSVGTDDAYQTRPMFTLKAEKS